MTTKTTPSSASWGIWSSNANSNANSNNSSSSTPNQQQNNATAKSPANGVGNGKPPPSAWQQQSSGQGSGAEELHVMAGHSPQPSRSGPGASMPSGTRMAEFHSPEALTRTASPFHHLQHTRQRQATAAQAAAMGHSPNDSFLENAYGMGDVTSSNSVMDRLGSQQDDRGRHLKSVLHNAMDDDTSLYHHDASLNGLSHGHGGGAPARSNSTPPTYVNQLAGNAQAASVSQQHQQQQQAVTDRNRQFFSPQPLQRGKFSDQATRDAEVLAGLRQMGISDYDRPMENTGRRVVSSSNYPSSHSYAQEAYSTPVPPTPSHLVNGAGATGSSYAADYGYASLRGHSFRGDEDYDADHGPVFAQGQGQHGLDPAPYGPSHEMYPADSVYGYSYDSRSGPPHMSSAAGSGSRVTSGSGGPGVYAREMVYGRGMGMGGTSPVNLPGYSPNSSSNGRAEGRKTRGGAAYGVGSYLPRGGAISGADAHGVNMTGLGGNPYYSHVRGGGAGYLGGSAHHPHHAHDPYGYPARPYGAMSPAPYQNTRRDDPGHGLRSPLLEEFRNNKSRKYELKDIFGHVVEFSGDQHDSRFIQQKLETANSDDKQVIFEEILPNSLQLMTDVFGNYVIQKFFEHGNQMQKTVIAKHMENHVLSLSLQMYGCRVVQKALEHVLTEQQATLVKELDGNVLKCVKDQNGNHVVQKALERVPPEHIQFIVNAFHGQVYSLATHPYGCRVIQRMLEHCQEAQSALLEELHRFTQNLIMDQYGNYVTQHIIERGHAVDKTKIINVVRGQVLQLSKHKFASNVVEKCIAFGSPEEKKVLIDEVLVSNADGSSSLAMLMKDQYGNYVLQKMLDVASGDQRDALIAKIKPLLSSLKKYSYGKHLVSIERLLLSSSSSPVSEGPSPSRSAAADEGNVILALSDDQAQRQGRDTTHQQEPNDKVSL